MDFEQNDQEFSELVRSFSQHHTDNESLTRQLADLQLANIELRANYQLKEQIIE